MVRASGAGLRVPQVRPDRSRLDRACREGPADSLEFEGDRVRQVAWQGRGHDQRGRVVAPGRRSGSRSGRVETDRPRGLRAGRPGRGLPARVIGEREQGIDAQPGVELERKRDVGSHLPEVGQAGGPHAGDERESCGPSDSKSLGNEARNPRGRRRAPTA